MARSSSIIFSRGFVLLLIKFSRFLQEVLGPCLCVNMFRLNAPDPILAKHSILLCASFMTFSESVQTGRQRGSEPREESARAPDALYFCRYGECSTDSLEQVQNSISRGCFLPWVP